MGKEQKSNKENKKKPAMTAKEKKASKNEKKKSNNLLGDTKQANTIHAKQEISLNMNDLFQQTQVIGLCMLAI